MVAQSPLSQRQTEILNQVAKGLSNKLIANRFGITEQTIKNQLVSILNKLGATNRTHAVVLAMCSGWLDITTKEVLIAIERR